jgi:hypothetical protein
MAKEGPNWDGLLKWSIANSDGTRQPRNLRYRFNLIPNFLFLCFVFFVVKVELAFDND